jgi:glycosyltransferase involved in cell wall biosynthesis
MPLFSFVTPTKDRKLELRMRYQQLISQTLQDWEWHILDTSLRPSSYFVELTDPRVHYVFSEEETSLGEKRNALKQAARGEWIVHCDDDDYFARDYLSFLLEELKQVDFLKADAWFSHDREGNQLYYVDAHESFRSYYHYDPMTGTRVREVIPGEVVEKCSHESLQKKKSQGYGFSFVYHREKTANLSFTSIDVGEDILFFREVEKSGLRIKNYFEKKGLLVKGLSGDNLSKHYAQYRLPEFTMRHVLPHYFSYLKSELE